MRLSKLLDLVVTKEIIGYKNVNVTHLTHNSKECKSGSVFFAIKGKNSDGNNYILDAINMGAKVVVTDTKNTHIACTQIVVEDVRKTMSIMAKNFYNKAVDKLKIIGVVGTAGKTTTTMIITHILQHFDIKCGVIGTNGIYINNIRYENLFTTPDPIELHKVFYDMQKAGIKYVVMEVSAQSIYYSKIYGVNILVGVFTNVSNEHLDFFKTMSNYIETKTSIFNKNCMQQCVINIDDIVGEILAQNTLVSATTVSLNVDADFKVTNIKKCGDKQKICFTYDAINYVVKSNLIGKFNVYNLMQAIAVCKCLKLDIAKATKCIENLQNISGRCNKYKVGGKDIIIDFAHTSDSIEKVLDTLQGFYKKNMIVVFGAVGYSDTPKRIAMARAVSKYSNKIIITSDNPGNTCFMDICADLLQGVSGAKPVLIEDRKSAILYAYNNMDKNELLVILGKGHETFQKIKNERVPYSDEDVINNLSVE